MTAQNVDGLIRNRVTQVGHGTNDAVVAPAGVFPCHPHAESFQLFIDLWSSGYWRCLEPSNFRAISFRYQARIVSGLATQAISHRAFLPTRFPFIACLILLAHPGFEFLDPTGCILAPEGWPNNSFRIE